MCVPSKTLWPTLKGCKWGYFGVFTERDWSQECCHGNNTVGVIVFLLWCTLLVLRLKNTALISLKWFLIECCAFFVAPPMTSSLFLICIMHKREYLQNEKRYAKKENAILLSSEKPFKLAIIIFLLHRHFRQTTTMTATRASLKKRFNEQNNRTTAVYVRFKS